MSAEQTNTFNHKVRMMAEDILRIDHISKQYRLGMIGGTTLRDELQRRRAKRKGLEDPTSIIGRELKGRVGEPFLALDDVSFTVQQGERIGIIGHNGAGKSTLLKLICRITAPSKGSIEMNGRVASMLEVGTGFHQELSGRENIYMNGAILGMTKAEIDKKIEEIIDFSECRQFIDTPVKRYSSGMYVKLAFSVAAHLDSEIMIMDEVLAVGDMAFQRKCIEKMSQVSIDQGRTILYVSHNMNTIRQLCDRCIVLDHGHLIFDGDVDRAIAIYMGHDSKEYASRIVVNAGMRNPLWPDPKISIDEILAESKDGIISFGEKMRFQLRLRNRTDKDAELFARVTIRTLSGSAVSMASTPQRVCIPAEGEKSLKLCLDTSRLVPGSYSLSFALVDSGTYGSDSNVDVLSEIYSFSVLANPRFNHGAVWNTQWWGQFAIDDLEIEQ